MPHRFHRHVLFAVLLALLAASAVAPVASAKTKPGRWHKDYRYGYAIVIPDDWSRVPPGTEETVEVGKWYGRAMGYVQPEMEVVRIDTRQTETTESGGDDDIPLPEDLRKRFGLQDEPTSVKEWLDDMLDRYRMYPEAVAKIEEAKDVRLDGENGRLYFATVSVQGESLQLLCAAVRKGDIDYGIFFQSEKDEFERSHERGFLACIKSFKFLEPKSEKDVDYDAAFDAENLPKDEQEQQRWLAKVKEQIDNVKEWDYVTTRNYLILYDKEVDLRDVKKVAVQIEAIRRDVYEKLFPPDDPIKAISVVRICKDHDQYSAYGGPGGSAGYWNSAAKELVFYFEDRDAIRVLYHEAFHQYIYYAFGSFAPHDWFNEGHGDYFAGFEFKGRFVPGRFEWRRGIIKNAIATDTYIPLKDILHYTHEQYYGPQISLCYAEGWSLVYFLRSTRNKEYRKILPTYFDVLKRELGGTKMDGAPEGFRDPAKTKEALDKALDEAFAGIDMDQLERDWKEFKY